MEAEAKRSRRRKKYEYLRVAYWKRPEEWGTTYKIRTAIRTSYTNRFKLSRTSRITRIEELRIVHTEYHVSVYGRVGETGRPLHGRAKEHQRLVLVEETDKTRLAQYARKEYHRIARNSASILDKEDNTTKRKLLNSVYMAITSS
ncbi:hypothetical protein Trydic_g20818 [Trypoxylus dichotomus]